MIQTSPPKRPVFEAERSRRTMTEALLDARDRVGGPKTILEDHDRNTLTYDRLILAASNWPNCWNSGSPPC